MASLIIVLNDKHYYGCMSSLTKIKMQVKIELRMRVKIAFQDAYQIVALKSALFSLQSSPHVHSSVVLRRTIQKFILQ